MEELNMHDEFRPADELGDTPYTDRELAMFAALPRESALDAVQEQRIIGALRQDGYFKRSSRRGAWLLQCAAALALFAGGGVVGAKYATRNSLEHRLMRADLTLTDRVWLLQEAGSAYVRAANGYADATKDVDSTAVEVARQILFGAAQAVARRSMDGGVTTRLHEVMHAPAAIQ
jgi:hypothetical protein